MAVEKIEEYKQQDDAYILKVFTKPTKIFPNGNYFYAPAEAIDLITEYTWGIKSLKAPYIDAVDKQGEHHSLHQELFNFYHGFYVAHLDHINHCRIDNVDQNLNVVTSSQNNYNKIYRKYVIGFKNRTIVFIPRISIGRISYNFDVYKTEDEACLAQYYAENTWLQEQLGDDWYMFDFKKYRQGSEDILDLERTGVISEEEAIYRHILRYADNAWYYFRYDLREYFKDNNIPIPKYSLDENGFMIHPITGQKLCPENLKGDFHKKDKIEFEEVKIKKDYIYERKSYKEVMLAKSVSLDKARAVRIMYADIKRKRVFTLLLQGYTPKQIIEITGFTSSVVYKAISTFDETFAKMFLESNTDSNITEEMINLYINCDFNYKKYRQCK